MEAEWKHAPLPVHAGPLPGESGVAATITLRMLAPEDRDHFIRERGSRLFHAARTTDAESIKRDGLRPGSEIGVSNKPGFHTTRSGHVYLCERKVAEEVVEITGPRALFAVDLRSLDPTRINPDEDMVFFSWLRFGDDWWQETPWIDAEPPWNVAPGQ